MDMVMVGIVLFFFAFSGVRHFSSGARLRKVPQVGAARDRLVFRVRGRGDGPPVCLGRSARLPPLDRCHLARGLGAARPWVSFRPTSSCTRGTACSTAMTSCGGGSTKCTTARSGLMWPARFTSRPSIWSAGQRLRALPSCGAVGLTPEAVLVVNIFSTFRAMFTHANIRTPRWLGYLIARPEMHAIHHERGVSLGKLLRPILHRHGLRHFPQPCGIRG